MSGKKIGNAKMGCLSTDPIPPGMWNKYQNPNENHVVFQVPKRGSNRIPKKKKRRK